MIEGLEIILERMKSHPEEFVASSKWTKVIGTVIEFLTPEEMDTIEKGLHQAHRDWFRGAVMQTLAGEQEQRMTIGTTAIASEDYYTSIYEAVRTFKRRKQEEAISQKMISPKAVPLTPVYNFKYKSWN